MKKLGLLMMLLLHCTVIITIVMDQLYNTV